MALATTCPRCKTSFRVVPDQLKLRRGFVRCGRCRNVFAGIDHLRYVDDGHLRAGADTIPDTNTGTESDSESDLDSVSGTSTDSDSGSDAGMDVGTAANAETDAEVEYVIVGTPPRDPLAHEPLAADDRPADEAAQVDDALPDDARPDDGHRDDTSDGPVHEAPAYLERYAEPLAADSDRPNEPAARLVAPDGFDDEGEGESAIDYFSTRRSRGFADRRGIAAAFVALALAVALVLQFVVAERATIAARAPALAPILAATLAPFGLDIGAPSELEALTIESFELQVSQVPDVLEMRALLRNHADHPVRWPSMQLTLTDRSDRVLVRRTLDPDDYLRDAGTTPDDGLPAQTEWPLHLALEARDLHLAGYDYRVRLFYP